MLQARLSGILNEINSALDLLPGKDMGEAALSYLKERATQRKGDKIKLCQFMGWWAGEEASKAGTMVHSHTGEAVNLPCSDDIDDTNSIQNNVSDVESVDAHKGHGVVFGVLAFQGGCWFVDAYSLQLVLARFYELLPAGLRQGAESASLGFGDAY